MKQWAVVKMNGGQKNFTMWHEDVEVARAEAERLARKEGLSYGVIELVGVCEVEEVKPPVVWRTV